MRIRRIKDSDWDRIVALETSAYADRALSEPRATLESKAHASPKTCLVLDVEAHLAGYLLSLPYPMFRCPELATVEETTRHSPNLHVHDLVIANGYRGRGLAKQLLHHLTAVASAQRYERISLIAIAGSGSFWSANGFSAHPEIALPSNYGAGAIYMSRPV